MFFSFLRKDNPQCPDISVLIDYLPDQVLNYYYNAALVIPLSTWSSLKQLSSEEANSMAPVSRWRSLIEDELLAGDDLNYLAGNEFLEQVGPYYYIATNTRLYFRKAEACASELFTSHDINTLLTLDKEPATNNELHLYQKSRKNVKKAAKNENDLIRDINMCLMSLREVEQLTRHMHYLNKLLQQRQAIVEAEFLLPGEPDYLPEKPQKVYEENVNSNLISFNLILNRKKRPDKENHFNHAMKVYIIRYREYEKACDRYKNVLENWENSARELIDRCFKDIEEVERKLKRAEHNLHIYNSVLSKSFINPKYQDIKTLSTFRYYLETGRAHNVQDCMNLFEEETRWSEIKASQERIENTIHFLQSGNENLRFAGEHVDLLLQHINDQEEKAVRA